METPEQERSKAELHRLGNDIALKNTEFPFPIVFFDGECVLCNKACQILLNATLGSNLKFAALQSEAGLYFLGEKATKAASIIFWEGGNSWQEKNAIIRTLKYCNGFGWQVIRLMAFITPSFIVNRIYGWVAKNRFSWFGKTACWLKDGRVLE